MNRNISLILGSTFILTSGIIFTIERLTAYVYWFAQTNTGEYPTVPEIPLFDNLFTGLFFVIGIALLVIAFKKEKS
ncbi:hypothetical protein WAX74_10700 [Psychrobacillus sp. FJAT-51614]|uniref:Uncharacterized protein n=1 Tax=Psychrobacillus mangrovi TaxID=3117745 RepID=A0ABU8F567_9BACI